MKASSFIVAIILVLTPVRSTTVVQGCQPESACPVETGVHKGINRSRKNWGLGALRPTTDLTLVAQMHTNRDAANNTNCPVTDYASYNWVDKSDGNLPNRWSECCYTPQDPECSLTKVDEINDKTIGDAYEVIVHTGFTEEELANAEEFELYFEQLIGSNRSLISPIMEFDEYEGSHMASIGIWHASGDLYLWVSNSSVYMDRCWYSAGSHTYPIHVLNAIILPFILYGYY